MELVLTLEAKLFCLIITAFLIIYKIKSLDFKSEKQKTAYIFAFIGILFSIPTAFLNIPYFKIACYILCGLCYALSIFFVVPTAKKALIILASISMGVLTFFSLGSGLNFATYLLVLAIIITFSFEQLKKITVDNLTKLYNRYGLSIEVAEQLRQYQRENSDSFYVIACDLDKFKQINDTWGHEEGDRALELVSAALSRVGKQFDSAACRIGGDEFVIITDKSDADLPEKITLAVQNELDNIDFREDFKIRMSIGTALYDGKTDFEELLKKADKKLYEAKKK